MLWRDWGSACPWWEAYLISAAPVCVLWARYGALVHRLSCPKARGILVLGPGIKPYPLDWQEACQPWGHQGSPLCSFHYAMLVTAEDEERRYHSCPGFQTASCIVLMHCSFLNCISIAFKRFGLSNRSAPHLLVRSKSSEKLSPLTLLPDLNPS